MTIESYEFPKTFEERMEAILSTINTEFKSITWSLMDYQWRTKNDIRMLYETGTGMLMDANNFQAYNNKTFVPIGLVAKKSVRKTGLGITHVYSLKEEGIFYQPIADFAIKTAVENDISMYEVFGQTSSRGKHRSPFMVYCILKELYKSKDVRIVDLQKKYGFFDTNIKKSIERLLKRNLIEYESVSPENPEGKFVYQWVEGKSLKDIKKISGPKLVSLKNLIPASRIFMEKREMDYKYLSENLGLTTAQASLIIVELKRHGFIKPKRFEGHSKLSHITITNKGREFFEYFLEPVENILKPDSLKLTDDIIATKDIVNFDYRQKAHNLYQPFSKRERFSLVERKDQIRKILINLGRARTTEVKRKFGIPSSYLYKMEKEGEVKKTKEGAATFWKLVS